MAFIAKLSHYLDDDLSLIKLPAPAAAIREFLGCIVEAVTSRDPDDINYVTQLKCRKGSGGCDGDIIVFFNQDNPSIIMWSCMFCKDDGQITGWKKTLWDKRLIT
ncbi:MAG: hypothetical protein ACYC54_15850 [Sedimentisphaerales bacterium]